MELMKGLPSTVDEREAEAVRRKEMALTKAIASTVDEREAARFFGLKNAKTLYHWRIKRIGPRYIKMGRLIRYRLEDLAAWQDSHMVEQRKAAEGAVKTTGAKAQW